MCLFLNRGQVYPVPPSLHPWRPCVVFSPLCLWWMALVGGCMRGDEVSGGVGWFVVALACLPENLRHPPTGVASH